jgi:hypothetical protein
MDVTNSPAYYKTEKVAAVKSLLVQVKGVYHKTYYVRNLEIYVIC